MSTDLEKEQQAHEATKAQLADVMSDGGSYRKLQVALDAALQKHVDDKAAHEADKAAALKQLAEQHTQHIEAIKAEHANELAALRAKLIPQMQDLQARQKADAVAKLEAAHAAELAQLKG